jgi:hypothetical protein
MLAVAFATVATTACFTALAHGLNNYWAAFWPTSGSQNEIAYDMTIGVPGGLGSSEHDHIAEGGKAWNQETDEILFKRSGDEVSNFPASNCDSHQSAIHYDEIYGTAVGTTIICGTGSTITGFQLTLDSLVPWWWSDATVPNNYFDAQAVATHEFGHAAGGWTNGTPERHFDENNNAALCGESVPNSDYHTMCAENRKGTNHWRSLESHDRHTFTDAYP